MPDTPELQERVLTELTISAPADMVWDALCDPAKIINWFGWDAPTLQEEIEFIFVKYGRPDHEACILRFEGGEDRFEVEARGDKTILRVVRGGIAPDSWEDVYQDMVEGWISFVEQLRLAIEQHDLAERRTIYLSGSAREGGGPLSDRLGIGAAVDAAPGEPVVATLSTGDRVDGIAWHRTSFQFGVTVPEWGDGLLIVTEKSVTADSPHGRGAVILTTYGLSEADFAALEARWKTWWDAHYREGGEAACS